MASKNELLANLRSENEILDEMRRTAQATLEDMANRQIGDITITGPKLPERLDNALKQFADQYPSAVSYDAAHGTMKWKSDPAVRAGKRRRPRYVDGRATRVQRYHQVTRRRRF